MKSFLWIWILGVVLTMASCSGETKLNPNNVLDRQNNFSDDIPDDVQDSNDNPGEMEGYIIFTETDAILIEDSDFNQKDIHLSVRELQRKYHSISFLYEISDSQKEYIKSGQKVRVGARLILESYPAKVYVTEIEVIEN